MSHHDRTDQSLDHASPTTPPERRNVQRAAIRLEADITLPGDLTIVSHTLDISASGISLEVPYMLESGQRCTIELDLSPFNGPKWVELIAEVRNCVPDGEDQFRAGMQFVDLPPEVAAVIAAI